MKNIKMPHLIFLTIIFSFFHQTSFSQTKEQAFIYADSLFIKKNFVQAIKEYQRILFFEDTFNIEITYKTAKAYYEIQNFDKAIEYYVLCEDKFIENQKNIDVKFEIINSSISNNNFEKALKYLYQFPDSLNYENLCRKNFYFGICYFFYDNYELSSKYFLQSIDSTYIDVKKELENYFKNQKNFKYANPKKAYFFSLLFPGLGQIYSNELKKGLNSLALTGIILFTAYKIYINYSIIDSIISILPYFERYYLGGCLNAYNLAVEKKRKKKSENFENIIEIIAKSK